MIAAAIALTMITAALTLDAFRVQRQRKQRTTSRLDRIRKEYKR